MDVKYDYAGVESPSVPNPPTFTGALLTVGTDGYASLSTAIAAASAGDRIQILPGTYTEATAISVSKSLEIFGTGDTCILERDSLTEVISIPSGVNNVYIHNLLVRNPKIPSTDANGQSSCITASTMQTGTPTGSTGIYIANCTFVYPNIGVSIDASDWVVRDSTFTPVSNTPGATIRAVSGYGSTTGAYLKSLTFTTPTESSRLIAVGLNSAG